MNVFQLNYEVRLQSWYELRTNIEKLSIKEKCILTDNYWQKAPLVNQYLHLLDNESWPGPWELISENTYCTIARALGICYTLILVNVNDIELVEATDKMGELLVLVLVDNAKYVLNYWPDTVVNNNSSDFSIKRYIDISKIKQKL